MSDIKVRVYMISNSTYEFPARDIPNAREIASRITREGLWIDTDDGEAFYPITQVYKVRIIT